MNTARPRDAAATKALLLEAATAEFAEHGLAGGRIDRVAERAGANKRLIYVYFGDKNQLFDAVVEEEARAVFEAAPMADGDLRAFAAARFDYMLANAASRRIGTWRTLEQIEPAPAEVDRFRARVDAVTAAQKEGRIRADLPAADLFAIVLRMTESWLSAPPALTAAVEPDRFEEHRAALVEAVRSVVEPR
ncbi:MULTISPECIES: TetR family transcriptional regulator [unclassified Amycolatopsis]|uniref:TetR family transcriptional regulator n=1 Tax=unclassified Amycolatopsis TaxID=2618356 RepID=UPI002E2418E9|nr:MULTISPECIES: TetR family transcriptional regulator [unclassified Amycolatopsis]